MVLDFAWSSSQHQQLVTWSRDCTLRVWELDTELQRKCGLETEEDDIRVECIEGENDEEGSFFKLDRDDENQEEIVKEGKAVIIEEDGAVIVNSPNSFQMKNAPC